MLRDLARLYGVIQVSNPDIQQAEDNIFEYYSLQRRILELRRDRVALENSSRNGVEIDSERLLSSVARILWLGWNDGGTRPAGVWGQTASPNCIGGYGCRGKEVCDAEEEGESESDAQGEVLAASHGWR